MAADVITGPVANDTIFDTLGIMSSGFLNPEDALKLLMIGPEYMQIAVKTEKAAKQLCFIRSERIERIGSEQRRKEQDNYQQMFAEELALIMDAGSQGML